MKEHSTRAGNPEGQTCSGLHHEKSDQQVEGGDSAPPLYSRETAPGVLHPFLKHPTQERHGAYSNLPEPEGSLQGSWEGTF